MIIIKIIAVNKDEVYLLLKLYPRLFGVSLPNNQNMIPITKTAIIIYSKISMYFLLSTNYKVSF